MNTTLKGMHNTQASIEKLRIALSNRVFALTAGNDDANVPVPAVYTKLVALAKAMEQEADKSIAEELKNWPIYTEWLSHVKGIGPSLSGQLLALLLPPIPTKGPSSWLKAAGIYAELRPDGSRHMPRPRAGEGKITYHPGLRRCLYNVAKSFVMLGGFYREQYQTKKAALIIAKEGNEEWSKHRIDAHARWSTITLFLSHLWEAWCEIEGIHNRGPYGLTTLPDGTKVLRYTNPDGSYTDHEYTSYPHWNGKTKI